ncbi:MAG: type V CRISPR-associated protein Cas12a/Cpf1 [Bacteroidota bacterium]
MKSTLDQFSHLYPMSKTLRFELIPQGSTAANIETKGFLKKDEERAESYKKMKETIDRFHQDFIEKAMAHVRLSNLEDFENLYNAPNEEKKEDKYKKQLEKVQETLRKEIAQGFKADEVKATFLKIDKKYLVTNLLEKWIEENNLEDVHFDPEFKKFTTYFSGFHQNRKNMYTDKEQSTAIAYRLVHENLPKFVDNMRIFKKIVEIPELKNKLETLYKEIEEYLGIISIEEAFELDYFNEVLSQKGIDVYNLILGGRSEKEGKKKIQGLNEYINLYNQKQDKKNKIPKLKVLYKQILSDRTSTSFLPDAFEDDEESSASQKVLDAINQFYHSQLLDYQPSDKDETVNILKSFQNLLAELKNYDLDKIYLRNDASITNISQKIFGNYGVFRDALNYYYENQIDTEFKSKYEKAKTDKKRGNLDKEKAKFTRQSYLPISTLQTALDNYVESLDGNHDVKNAYSKSCVVDYFKDHFKAEPKEGSDKEFDFISNIEAKLSTIKGLLNTPYPENERLHQDKKKIDDIKLFLDSIMEYLHFIKPLALPEDFTLEKDEHFYTLFEEWYEQMQLLIPLYNKVRNYATQKPYSTEKFKLNFENSSFLSGWAADYNTKGGLIIKKDDKFYLCIVEKKLKKEDIEFLKSSPDDHLAHRVIYDFQKPDNKNVPRIFIRSKGTSFAPAVQKYDLPVESIIHIYDEGLYKTNFKKENPAVFKKSLVQLIDYFKLGFSRHDSYKHYDFEWKESEEYENIADFYQDVINSCYELRDEAINFDNLHKLIDQGKLYLFQIYNKDFSKYSKGKSNLHTMYWRALFEKQNLKDVVYKLNGEAEMFYRKKSIEDKRSVVHQKNKPIDNKNPNNDKKSSVFDYDIVKDRRYTVDKFQFHVPITLNFKAKGSEYINNDVLDYLNNNPDVKIIGLDRGERHLIYLTMIDQEGNIIEQETLNSIVNKKHKITTNYHQLLDDKEKDRDKARKNWGTVETIKELKEGYISQVVHKIAKMMVEHNAIVVMEDLNMGFKRGRFKVEKQVYQKLEKMLIDKLNYLVLKDKKPDEPAGIYNALQLTNKFESFQKIGKQSGFLFYVPAWNTSKIDPTTGFVNLFHVKYESVNKAKAFFSQFKSIRYNKDKGYFEFDFDYNDFTTRAEGTRSEWTVCTFGDRIKTFRNADKVNQWDNEEINLTEAFEDFFGKHEIVYGDGTDFKDQITAKDDKAFFTELIHLFRLTLQMRNSITNSEVDYLISPVKNNSGTFYDSRKADASLPKDADANGAYHIAKKGLQWVNQIQEFDGDDWKRLKLNKTNKGWLKFVQDKV